MKEFSKTSQAYIFVTTIGGIFLLFLYLPEAGWNTVGIYVLAGLAAIGQSFKLEGPTERSHYNLGWLVYGFSIVYLDLPSALFVILAAHLVEWLWHKYPWYIQVFNIGVYSVSMTIAYLIFNNLNPDGELFQLVGTVALILALIAFTFTNHLMVGVVIKLARGQSFAESGVFDLLTLMIDFTMLSMGAATALVWIVNPYAAILNVVPLYLIHNALRVPALQRQVELVKQGGN